MEKRAFLAVLLSLLVLVVYQEWLARNYPPAPPPAPAPKQDPPAERSPPKELPELKPAAPVSRPRPQDREVRVETDNYSAIFSNKGGRLKSFVLNRYRTAVEEKSPAVELITHEPGVAYPLGVRLGGSAPYDDENLLYTVMGSDLKLTGEGKGTLGFEGQTPTGVTIKKQLTFTGSSYGIDLDVTVTGHESPPGMLVTSSPKGPASDTHFEGFLGIVGGKLIREHTEELKNGKEFSGTVAWAGFGYTYFLMAVLPDMAKEAKVAVKESGSLIAMETTPTIASKDNSQSRYTLFIGPKELDLLRSFERGLERSIDFGYFYLISVPLLHIMQFLHRFTGSYGLDIILITVFIKLLTAPLTHKSYVSMKEMQKLQPQMERLKEKYKDDREKLNKEIMELYRRNKVNPLGGCLPMILQIPVFIGLYNALLTPIELRHAPFLWIKDLSRPDWESLPFHFAGWSIGLPVLTILMGASMFIQQWMTPTAGDPNQRRMMLLMPIMFTVMFINFPSGLTIYWLINNILSIAQQYLVNRLSR